jgi:hypothetical protein
MAQNNDAATNDKVHKANSAQVVAQLSANAARAATVPANVGRAEPAMDLNVMQGSANGVVPNRFLVTRGANSPV